METEHNVEACYSLDPALMRYIPCIMCSCGWSVTETTWQDAGYAYDAHLAKGEPPATGATP